MYICDIFPLKVLFLYVTVTQNDASKGTITVEGGQSEYSKFKDMV